MDSSEEGRGRRRYPLAKVKGGWTPEEDAVLKRWDQGRRSPAFGGFGRYKRSQPVRAFFLSAISVLCTSPAIGVCKHGVVENTCT